MSDKVKVTRVSSAIDLDLTRVVEEIVRLVRDDMGATVSRAVTEVVMPALAQVDQRMAHMAALLASAALGPEQMEQELASTLPDLAFNYAEVGFTSWDVAKMQVRNLLAAGYALVPVSGAALEHAAGVAESKAQPTASDDHRAVRQTLEQRGLIPPQGRVESLLHSGTASDDLADWTSGLRVQRADERLSQAQAEGSDSSWHEGD